MDPKVLRQLLGLQESATDEQVAERQKQLVEALGVKPEGGSNGGGTPPANDPKNDDSATKLAELLKSVLKLGEGEGEGGGEGAKGGEGEGGAPKPNYEPGSLLSTTEVAAFKSLAENNPAVKKLLEQVVKADREHAKTIAALRLSEVNRRLDEVTIGSTFAVAPAVRDELRKILMECSQKFAEQLYSALGKIVDGSGLIRLGEIRTGSDWRKVNGSATATLDQLVARKMSEGKMTYSDAVVAVSAEDPNLIDQYYEEQLNFGSGGANG